MPGRHKHNSTIPTHCRLTCSLDNNIFNFDIQVFPRQMDITERGISQIMEGEASHGQASHFHGHQNVGFSGSSSDPDVILRHNGVGTRPPITTQPSVTSVYNSPAPWTYTPSGPAPLPRPDFYGSSNSVYSDVKVTQTVEPRDSVSVSISTPMGSRDWSRGLFGAFRDARMDTKVCRGLKLCKL